MSAARTALGFLLRATMHQGAWKVIRTSVWRIDYKTLHGIKLQRRQGVEPFIRPGLVGECVSVADSGTFLFAIEIFSTLEIYDGRDPRIPGI